MIRILRDFANPHNALVYNIETESVLRNYLSQKITPSKQL